MLFWHEGEMIVEVFNEKVNYENPFLFLNIFQAERNSEGVGRWHYHKELEILVILEGSLEVYVEEELHNMQKGDVLLIGSSQLHRDRTYADSGLKYIVFQFDIGQYFDPTTMPYIKYFSETRRPLSHLNYIFTENQKAKRQLYDCVEEIYRESKTKGEGYEIAVSILIKKILLTLLRSDARKLLNHKDDTEILRLKPALDYIEQNINEKIQVEDASKIINISYYYFVKYFKKVMGMSFTEYVNYRKIKRAERILLTRDISISQVGETIGMPNMAHFYKTFRKYNDCSPSEFRKKMLNWNH